MYLLTKAIERAEKVENRGYYFDLLNLYKCILKRITNILQPNPTTYVCLDYQLDYILNVEGLENRFERHLQMANIVRNWAEDKFELFADKNHLSRTVTTIKNTRNISVADLNNELKKRGMMISNGYGDLKEKTFRIAHMADKQPQEIEELLDNINDILKI